MNKLILLFFVLFFLQFSSQESFTMNYGCLGISTKGKWGKTQKTKLKVQFSVGSNKDIIFITTKGKNRFVRTAEPTLSETPKGMRFQVIPVVNNDTKYIFQYMENYHLRLIRVEDNYMIEYGCVENFDEDEGVSENNYAVVSDKAYFYSSPKRTDKKSSYLIYGQIVQSLSEKAGFIYVIYINSKGIKTKGWLSKSDLENY